MSDPVRAPELSVIIVSWNVRDDVLRCLEALRQNSKEADAEILLVDNASGDGTVEAVREHFPAVRVIANRTNAGFPRANNQALALARGRYVLFLNPDTEVGPSCLATCMRTLEEHPDIGMVGCRLEYPDGSIQPEGGRNAYRLRHLLFEVFYLHMLFPTSPVFGHQLMGDWDHRGRRDVEAICGAFMMVRRSIAESLGGLPEEVFMYHEDLAFCLRVRDAGHRIRYLGDVRTIHYANRSSRKSRADLGLLEGEYKVRLIRERQGRVHGAAARLVFGVRGALRLLIATIAAPLPGLGRLRDRFPRVFDRRRHRLQLLWSISPRLVAEHMPRPE